MEALAGLSTLKSGFGPPETMRRLIASVTARGMTIFARIDHGAGAAEAGLPLRATELLVFGRALSGTPLMQAAQSIGIDLPLKALVWQDEDGAVWIGWNDPDWIASRHGLASGCAAAQTMREVLAKVAHEAAGITI
jgi:uncharacterized protein (DUF302 family)